ncbi:winged helix DNA-binding domain-containing protein [Deinococcus cellulosilyticus]|uniref:Winged helix DNA-binding domain-containing protein n=1 Tax=Deinococcus cellulosilyticus (strain DSM 18568 / NBRC 106333 / KACC 11606 / 5516J-15) TaxID=1223518 RepID=A0A511N6Y6_DEIC1|nr:winged helix DNA-binding domain-containing protein [Deinococcus cellulosilyticus]GEM48580.1 hypothetical protein DC3_42150 [Deinococcus cellulosilyticus NBRC 106333 = KACC 11606]
MPTSPDVLSVRALNRATLHRQHLIQRSDAMPLDLIQHLVGLQAQMPNPPYVGLWARLEHFHKADLTCLIEERKVVRAALMRSTLHLVTAQDYLELKPLIQPVLERQYRGSYGKQLNGLDPAEVAAAAREILRQQPLNNQDLGLKLQEVWPDHDPHALAQAARNFEGLIHVPPAGTWGHHKSALLSPGEVYLGEAVASRPDLGQLILRYLGAFGPATLKDISVWSGLTSLKPALQERQGVLRTFRDELGRELFDLADAALPDPDLPISPRFLPEFDNLLLSHFDRSRVMDAAAKEKVFTRNGIIRSAVLIDGFVQGLWKVEEGQKGNVLRVQMFQPFSKQDRDMLVQEGLKLLDFVAEEGTENQVQFSGF